ncbi:MAG: PAS domain S-box protein [Planctomycetota bacterium]|nr:PAS domain S-box protein [Planctomycetota bacterium]MDA1140393.1 PAS domain S-box protein [Planctomycetota bacterium]
MSDKNVRTLIVEGRRKNSQAIAARLQTCPDLKCEITIVETFQDCIDELEKETPDLVLLSLALPDAKGVKKTLLKLMAKAPQIPVLVILDEDDPALTRRALRSGVQDVISLEYLDATSFERTIVHAMARQEGLVDFSRFTRELQASEGRVRSIIRNSRDGIVVVDKSETVRYCNAAAWSLFGKQRAELIDHPFQFALDMEGTHQIQFEQEAGKSIHVELSVSEFDWEGQPSYLVQMRDITKRVNAEIALKDSEALYHSMVETLPMQVFRKNLTGRFTFANDRLCESLGLQLEEILGKTDLDFSPPDLAEKYIRDDLGVMQTGEHFEDIEEWERPDGKRIAIQVLKTPIYDSQNRIIGVQGFFLDVTERQQAQQALREAAQKLAESNRMLKEFAFVISHDLQEPLRAVSSYLDLLKNRLGDDLDDKSLQFIDMATEGANRMRTLIQDLLRLSRVETQGKPLEPADSSEILRRTQVALRIAIEESGARITHDEMPTVVADVTQLQQLLQNLLSNAIKYRGDRTPEIHVGAKSDAASWEFYVRDNGIGIEDRFKSRIFGIFERLHTRQEYPGNGIGLAICKKIVERHGGTVWLDSIPGEGSTFHFTLPKQPV